METRELFDKASKHCTFQLVIVSHIIRNNNFIISFSDSDKPVTYISRNPSFTGVRSHTFTAEPDDSDIDKKVAQTKSLTLPGNDRHKGSDSLKNFSRPPNPNLPGYPYRAPSPIYLADSGSDQQQSRRGQVAFSSGGKSVGSKRSLFRRRAESVDNSRNRHKV